MDNRISPKRHVLLVDDEKNLTRMLGMILETRGYDVQTAETAQEALAKVNPDCDLILLDLVLPDASGFDVCRVLKQTQETRHIPIIILSAHSVSEDKLEALYLGADDFLAKPCEHEELIARMEAVLRRSLKLYQDERTTPKSVIRELRRILDDALIVPHFQPIYLFENHELYGLEILTRPMAGGTLLTPEELFEAALQYGLYSELEVLSWSMALGITAGLLKDEKLFLNCNPYFIESSQFLRVKAMLEKNKILPQDVVLEITERSAISDFKIFYEQLTYYRNYGFRFAIDDAGGGYSSLEAIIETKPEVVKIDRHITHEIDKDTFKQSIIKFLVSFCEENNVLSVAEGIETKAELDTVCKLGVRAGQGFYLCRPTPRLDLPNFRTLFK